MSKVYIAQLLCPERHCILAAYDEFEDLPSANQALGYILGTMYARALVTKVINPWCGICRSTDWHVEIAATVFETRAEAQPFMEECQRRQDATRRYLEGSKN